VKRASGWKPEKRWALFWSGIQNNMRPVTP